MMESYERFTDTDNDGVLLDTDTLVIKQVSNGPNTWLALADDFTTHDIEDNDVSLNTTEPWLIDNHHRHSSDPIPRSFGWYFNTTSLEDVEAYIPDDRPDWFDDITESRSYP